MSSYRSTDLLARYLAPQWPQVILLAVFLLATIGLQLLGPWVLRTFIDTAAAHGPLRTLTAIAVAFIGIAVATQGMAIAEAFVAENRRVWHHASGEEPQRTG